LFADSYDVQALRNENQWLLQCLHASERACKEFQNAIKQQQRRIKQLEKASATTNQPDAAQLERQWTLRLQQKEKEWMQEYDAQVQSLLRIIQHHESARARLESELHEMGSATAECASSATQTDCSSDIDEGEEEVEDVVAHGSYQREAAHDARCRSCSDARRLHETEEERIAHPFAIQVRAFPMLQLLIDFTDSQTGLCVTATASATPDLHCSTKSGEQLH
ncbi:hypothetical protein Gpo141_00013487, partial [Globisporangium polare]